ncbi:SDR family oxidoreductase [Nocardioides sp. CFH 31398]|uniref:SDR family NAD(P)-dependent oxidoreductase n=1 Tax=Nocardioides sp. CFH 31398 TaxID=2919579 RepID=UPI001F064BC6|nr:SDR family NAD(P)-dependent oxidoreductase [Nocardioides sp. CFH 31398]MCH1865489.1 SDR family NAD(P)-dependent oxidoreductase [Nocardioides sp. CFH 31398]
MPRVCLVTGASSGIGRSVAHELAGRGAALVLLARRREVLEEIAQECRDRGAASVDVQPADVSDDEAVGRAVAATVSRHGRLDVVVHCAGLVTYGDHVTTDSEDFRSVMEVNLVGAATVARHALPVMRSQGRGSFVLVGSLLGHVAIPGMTAYVVSKWGVRALARQLKIENADVPGLRIAYVAPGSVDTPIYERALADGSGGHRPPPPTMSPERAAKAVVRHVDGRRHELQTAFSNHAVIAAFDIVPAVYDRLIGPAFRLLSRRG